MIGNVRRVDLREAWQHEALDCTTWLRQNLDPLNHALDVRHSGAERQQSGAAFFFVKEGLDGEPMGRIGL